MNLGVVRLVRGLSSGIEGKKKRKENIHIFIKGPLAGRKIKWKQHNDRYRKETRALTDAKGCKRNTPKGLIYFKGQKKIKNIQQQVFAGGHPPNY
jgi:hypothetical protein